MRQNGETAAPAGPQTVEQVAVRVSDALQSADLTDYRDLLDPNVQWGAPDDPEPSCHNRDQVMAWYRRGRAKGVRASVTETVVRGNKIMVGLRVRPAEVGDPTDRWQVLTLSDGLIIDIRGFEERSEAVSRLT